jgi:hypothetical protein
MTDTLITRHFQPTERPRPNRQGRSKKVLRPVIEHDGRVWVARYEGRPGLFFAATKQEAQNNLQAGA